EALLAREFPQKTVWSAGLGALVGQPADPFSVEISAEHGLDLSAHRGQQLAGWMCQKADLILVMEQSHKTQLEQQYPLTRGKVYRLGDIGKYDIADPYRNPRQAFESAYAEIARGVADWVPRIRKLS